MSTESYQAQLPLDLDNDSRFIMISGLLDNIKQNLRMILLTNPGEKLFDPKFGVGIYKYLFEPTSGIISVDGEKITLQNLRSTLDTEIRKQIYTYLPGVTIESINITTVENTLNIQLNYSYKEFINDSMTLSVGA